MAYKGKNIIVIVGITFLVILSYITFLNKPLASDDYFWSSSSYAQNPLSYFVRDMLPNDPDTAFFRPLPIQLFALESRFKGAFPILPNSINLFLHISTTVLIGLLISLPYKGKIPIRYTFASVAGMLIFALHPQATGAVCWVSARFDLMCGFFGLAGIYTWLASISKRNVLRWQLIAIFCFVLSMLSKETGVIFPLSIFLWEILCFITSRKNIPLKNQVVTLSYLLIIVVLYSIYRYSILGNLGGYSHISSGSLGLSGLIGYALVMFWPFANMGPVPLKILCAVLIAITAGIVLLTNKTEKSDNNVSSYPWALLLLICACSCILLSTVPLTIKQVLYHAESRYSYIPLICFSVLIGWLLKRLRRFQPCRLIMPVFLLLFLSFSILAQQVEIYRWNKAGNRAESILNQIVTLVPNPRENATFLFGFPQLMASDRYYYVFGTGLSEALTERYQRTDLNILQWPDDNVLMNPPENSYIFKFNRKEYEKSKKFKIELTNSPDIQTQ